VPNHLYSLENSLAFTTKTQEILPQKNLNRLSGDSHRVRRPEQRNKLPIKPMKSILYNKPVPAPVEFSQEFSSENSSDIEASIDNSISEHRFDFGSSIQEEDLSPKQGFRSAAHKKGQTVEDKRRSFQMLHKHKHRSTVKPSSIETTAFRTLDKQNTFGVSSTQGNQPPKRSDPSYSNVMLNCYGACQMVSLLFMLVLDRGAFLTMPLLFKLFLIAAYYQWSEKVVTSETLVCLLNMLLVGSLQKPLLQLNWQQAVDDAFQILSSLHLLWLLCSRLLNVRKMQPPLEILLPKIPTINDQSLKKLVNKIPYGIGVINLENVSHFNHSFASILGLTRGQKNNYFVQDALKKFKRKPAKPGQVQSLVDQLNRQDAKTNLVNDLHVLFKNRASLDEKQCLFQDYFIDNAEENLLNLPIPKLRKGPSKIMSGCTSQSGSKGIRGSTCSAHQLGQKRFYNVSISNIFLFEADCFLITVKDITNERQISKNEILGKLQNMIFKSFTHELNTPIHQMAMTIDTGKHVVKELSKNLRNYNKMGPKPSKNAISQDIKKSEAVEKDFKVISAGLLMLRSNLHDLFDYYEINNQNLELNITDFDLKKCM